MKVSHLYLCESQAPVLSGDAVNFLPQITFLPRLAVLQKQGISGVPCFLFVSLNQNFTSHSFTYCCLSFPHPALAVLI